MMNNALDYSEKPKKYLYLLVLVLFIILSSSDQAYKKSIFDNLLSDIKSYDLYKNDNSYIVREEYPKDYLLPEKIIFVTNNCIEIAYWPDYYVNHTDDYVPTHIIINKKTEECLLGIYIDTNIDEISKIFLETPEIRDGKNNYKLYSYLNNDKWMYVIITTENEKIIKIEYGYQM